MESTKKCTKCEEIKDINMFGKNPRYKNGIISWCKICTKVSVDKYRRTDKGKEKSKENLNKWRSENRVRYNKLVKFSLYKSLGIEITKEEYITLYERQKGCCAICGVSDIVLGKELVLDHCHITNKVRGFLCSNCNTGIGLYKDDTFRLENALLYLSNHE